MNLTPADGTYIYSAPITGHEVVALWSAGHLTALSERGEARTGITPLTAAHVAHEISYLDGVTHIAPAPTIGKARAHQLHQDLARAGIRDHYAYSSEVAGVPVTSLAALLPEEARAIRAALNGLPARHAA